MTRSCLAFRLLRYSLLRGIALLAMLVAIGSMAPARAQTSPVHGPLPALPASEVMPLADYLGLLQQLAPSAAQGAKVYLAAHRLLCGHTLSTAELRQAMAKDRGNPVLMGLIRAAQTQDTSARAQWARQVECHTKVAEGAQ